MLLNKVLSGAFKKYQDALQDGISLELEADVAELVRRMIVPIVPEAAKIFDAEVD